MGGWRFRVGDYTLEHTDYYEDELPRDEEGEYIDIMDKGFFDTLLINCTIQNIISGKEKEMDIPCSELYTIKEYDDGSFQVDYDGHSPRNWLFDTLKKQGKKIEISPRLSIHCSEREYYKTIPDYYLQSELRDEDIKVGLIKRTFQINDIADLDWFFERGFIYGRKQ